TDCLGKRHRDQLSPFILTLTSCASFSISSALRTTFTESTFSLLLSTYSLSSVESRSSFSVSRLSSSLRCWFAFFSISFRAFEGISGLVCSGVGTVPGIEGRCEEAIRYGPQTSNKRKKPAMVWRTINPSVDGIRLYAAQFLWHIAHDCYNQA